MDEIYRWIIGIGITIILGLIAFIAGRLFKEQERQRDRVHAHQDEIIKVNAQVSMLKELFTSVIEKLWKGHK